MIPRLFIFLLCLLAVIVIACDQGITTPTKGEPFSFKLVVRDHAGNPRPNLRVSVYPPLDLGSLPKSAFAQSPSRSTASSTVNFALATAARVNLSLNDLDGTVVQQMADNALLNSGLYAYTFSLRLTQGARVMICRLVVTDTANGTTAFRDSIYVTLWQPDAQVAVFGYTSGTGTFESHDTLAFPYILSLPPIVVTRFDPTPVGTFTFPDSCTITLTDTANGTRMTFNRHLVHGPNKFDVAWNPTGKANPAPRPATPSDLVPSVQKPMDPPVFDWRLYQNYPNPFN